MKFLCIMGDTQCNTKVIAYVLEQMGYKRIIPYTTRQISDDKLSRDFRYVTKEEFNNLINTGIIIEHSECNGDKYGTPRPYGATKYVANVEKRVYEKLRSIYGDQIIGVYLGEKQEHNSKDLINIKFDKNTNINIVVADILKSINNERKEVQR